MSAHEEGEGSRPLSPAVLAVAAVGVVVVPILLLLIHLRSFAWFPTGDLAQAEMRLIDFWSHPPLVGAAGRIASEAGIQGNHPGPAMFFAVWPLWRVFGGSAWATSVSVGLLNVGWIAAAFFLVWRRSSAWGVLALSVPMALLVGSYGLEALTEFWNPWMALGPWLVFLVAVWSCLDGEPLLWLATFTGCYVIGCHVGYLVLVPPLLLLALVARVRGGGWRGRSGLTDLGASVGVGALMWTPALIDQFTREPGNLTILWEEFGSPKGTPLGLVESARLVLRTLDPWGPWFRRGVLTPTGSVLGGTALLVVVGLLAGRTWGRSPRSLRTLDLTLGAAVVVSWLVNSRLFGDLFFYLVRWLTPLVPLLVLAALWHIRVALTVDRGVVPVDPAEGGAVGGADALRPSVVGTAAPRPVVVGAVGLALVAVSTVNTVRFFGQEPGHRHDWEATSALAPEVAGTLDPGGTYFVAWQDPLALGGMGFGLVLELSRRGYHVTAGEGFSAAVEPERVGDQGSATAVLTVVTGPRIADWERHRTARKVAEADPRSVQERRKAVSTRKRLTSLLAARGIELGPTYPVVLYALDESLPEEVRDTASELLELGDRSAVFVTAPTDPGPPERL